MSCNHISQLPLPLLAYSLSFHHNPKRFKTVSQQFFKAGSLSYSFLVEDCRKHPLLAPIIQQLALSFKWPLSNAQYGQIEIQARKWITQWVFSLHIPIPNPSAESLSLLIEKVHLASFISFFEEMIREISEEDAPDFFHSFESHCSADKAISGMQAWMIDNASVLNTVTSLTLDKLTYQVPNEIMMLSNLRDLTLSHAGLFEVPLPIRTLKNLKHLAFSHNLLSTIPSWFDELSDLESLFLDGNRFENIPIEISKITKLDTLDIQKNRLRTIPKWFCGMRLEILNLSNNPLGSIPSYFKKMIHLKWLSLFRTEITELPNSIQSLTRLETLDCSGNAIRKIPEWIQECRLLKQLNFSGNPVQNLPEELSRLTLLESLDLCDLNLSFVPWWFARFTALKFLELSYNRFTYFPVHLLTLPHLQVLNLKNNPVKEAPWWITDLTCEIII